MPFTLAHPAAVLPFRRFCPQKLSFPALVVGSVAPDLGYWSGPFDLERISHGFFGAFYFDLPLSLLMLIIIYLLRSPIARLLPASLKDLWLAMWPRQIGTPISILISLMLGIWTHLLWDTFTHNHGWLVEHVKSLQAPVFTFHQRYFRVSHLISYACSVMGVAVLIASAAKWREQSVSSGTRAFTKTERWKLFWIACLALPITAIHHLFNSLAGLCIVAVLSLLMIAATAKVLAEGRMSRVSN